jgi:hypothetical protein
MNPNRWSLVRESAPLVLTTLAASLLSLDYWLQRTGLAGLCPTDGCELVGTFVKSGEITMIGLGAIFFLILTGLLVLGRWTNKPWLWVLTSIVLTAGLAFNGGILGFQHFGIQEFCALCYGVVAALFLILAAFGWMRRSLIAVVMGVAVWSAAFASQALFLFPQKTPDLQQTVLTTFQADQLHGPQLYYFFSLHCPFCTQILASLATHPPQSGDWHLIPLDTQPDDQRRLAAWLDHPRIATNPFRAFLDVKQSPPPDVPIQSRIKDAAHKGVIFLRNSGYYGVPLLIVQETPSKRVVLQGREPILNYLLEKRLISFRLFF